MFVKKHFLTMYFDKLRFSKFVFICLTISSNVYETDLKLFHCVSFLFQRNMTLFCALRIGWLTEQIKSTEIKLYSTKTNQKENPGVVLDIFGQDR